MTPEAKIEEIFHAHLVNINMFYGDMDKSEQWETNQVCLVDAIQALIVEARYQSEIWEPYMNFPFSGEYEVSSAGRVRRSGRVLAPADNGKGYLVVSLSKENKYKNYLVHRLVAQVFIINSKAYDCVNHIDGNKQNNCVANLEWCTYSENEKHSYKLGKVNSQSKLTPEQAQTIHERLQNGDTLASIAKDYGVHFTLISQIKRGLLWKQTDKQLNHLKALRKGSE